MRHNQYLQLFWEFFKTSLFVVGGGYAIAAEANDKFGKRLRWLKEDEILDNLPLISSVPGLIAGNTAIFTGLKTAGRLGAVAALSGAAVPSLVIFTLVSYGFTLVPNGNALIEGSFLALRSSLTAVVAITMYSTLMRKAPDFEKGIGVELKPLRTKTRITALCVALPILAAAAIFHLDILCVFLSFGTICIGGGFPLVPFYSRVFTGPEALFVGMTEENFSNLMALTQMTPGPVSVNAATFFGISMGGIFGGIIATAALLTPSYFMMTGALTALYKLKKSNAAKIAFAIMKPISLCLMSLALWKFATMSVVTRCAAGNFELNLTGLAIFAISVILLKKFKFSVMASVASSAAAGFAIALLNQWRG
jgi:chromate transporter